MTRPGQINRSTVCEVKLDFSCCCKISVSTTIIVQRPMSGIFTKKYKNCNNKILNVVQCRHIDTLQFSCVAKKY